MKMNTKQLTADTLEQMDGASNADMIKAWMAPGGATNGIQNYDLEKPALSLFPVETPFVNKVPTVSARGGIQANWRAVTGVNVNGLSIGLGQGNRGGVMTTSTADYYAAYRSMGLDDFVTEEAERAADDYMDLVARGQVNLMYAAKVQMERVFVGGLGFYGLGQTNRPAVADLGTGGALAYNTTYSVICVALTLDGYLNSSIANGIPGLVSRTNADGTTDQYGGGSAQPSQNRAVTTANDTNNTHSLTATVVTMPGAVAYAWFWGAAGAEALGAITTINSVKITANAAGAQLASSLTADNSQNNLICDGFLSQIARPGFGGYVASQATGAAGTGTGLTADGEGGIVEIDADLQYFYDTLRLSPTCIWVSSQEQKNISKKIGQGPGTGTSNIRFNRDASNGSIAGGVITRSYLNRFTPGITGGDQAGQEIPIALHPNLPPGTMMYETDTVPYPLNNVGDIVDFIAQRDWYATLWPQTTRKKEFGVYRMGVLRNKFIPAWGVRTNIANS